jgi:hypothetical protein
MDDKPKKGVLDAAEFRDHAEVGLAGYVPPIYPCPQCKGESKESGIKGWRVCCGDKLYVGLTERELLELMEDRDGYRARVQAFEVMYKKADQELTDALRIMRERGWEPQR